MEDYVIASNSDNRIETFYIDGGKVMHAWQKSPSDPTSWTEPNELYGENHLTATATRVEACTDTDGQIHVIAYTSDNKYYTCYQSPGKWHGWEEITQS